MKLKIARYDHELLSWEDQQQTVHVSVTQQTLKPWMMEDEMVDNHQPNISLVMPPPEDVVTEEMELPLPADGMIPLHIPVKNDTEILMIEVGPASKDEDSL